MAKIALAIRVEALYRIYQLSSNLCPSLNQGGTHLVPGCLSWLVARAPWWTLTRLLIARKLLELIGLCHHRICRPSGKGQLRPWRACQRWSHRHRVNPVARNETSSTRGNGRPAAYHWSTNKVHQLEMFQDELFENFIAWTWMFRFSRDNSPKCKFELTSFHK